MRSVFLLAPLIELISRMTPARFCRVAMLFSKTRRFSMSPLVNSLYSLSFSLANKSFSVLDSRPNGLPVVPSSIMVSKPLPGLCEGRGGRGTSSPESGPTVYPLPLFFFIRPRVGRFLTYGSSRGPAEFRPPRVKDLALLFGPTEFLRAREREGLLIANAIS